MKKVVQVAVFINDHSAAGKIYFSQTNLRKHYIPMIPYTTLHIKALELY